MEAQNLYEDRVYTIPEVAAIFRIPAETVKQLIQEGDLPAVHLGQIYRIPKSVIDRYFETPMVSHFSPEDLGFGMWADDETIGDSVEYVNQLRSAEGRTLREAKISSPAVACQ